MLSSIILALSLSIDAIGIGVAYGIRKIKISKISYMIIAAMSFLVMSVSITIGRILGSLISEDISKLVGTIILAFLGIWVIYQGIKNNNSENSNIKEKINKESKKILSIIIKSFGITIQIIKTPECCDIDKSSVIDAKESFYLGVALSIDSIGVGISSAIMGIYIFYLPIYVCIFQIILLAIGINAGGKIKFIDKNNKICSILSGSILILVSICRYVI